MDTSVNNNNNNQSTLSSEDNNMSTIQQLFNEFIEAGGQPKVTEFKRYFDGLVKDEIKQLCGRSGRSAGGDDWRSELKDRFGGRGAKWQFVSIDEIMPTLKTFNEEEVKDYIGFISQAEKAWIRYNGPRVVNGVHSAAFEVRVGGSTIDHPRHLHYIAVTDLDEKTEPMNATPHSMKLEVVAKPQETEVEVATIEEDQEAFSNLVDAYDLDDVPADVIEADELVEEEFDEDLEDEDFDAAF